MKTYITKSYFKQILIAYSLHNRIEIVNIKKLENALEIEYKVTEENFLKLRYTLAENEQLRAEQFKVAKERRHEMIDNYYKNKPKPKAKKEPKKEPKEEVKKEPKDNNILEQLKDKSNDFEDMLDSFLKESESNNNKKDKKKRGR